MLVTPLGRRIKRLRIDAGLTVRDLAKRVGKSAAYIAKIEVRGVAPTADLVRQIAHALGADSAELLELARQVRIANAAQGVHKRYADRSSATPLIGNQDSDLVTTGARKLAPIISLINMKGGVGKTTLAMQLAHTADSMDLRTLAVDLDPQSNLSQALMGPEKYAEHLRKREPTIVDIFDAASRNGATNADIDPIIVKRVGYWDETTLDLIPSRLELSDVLKSPHNKERRLAKSLRRIRDKYDVIIIDCAPTESILTEAAYHASDYVVVPIKPEFMATIGLPLLASSMEQFRSENEDSSIDIAGLVFVHSSSYSLGPEGQRSIADVTNEATKHGWHIFAHQVPYAAAFAKAARERTPLSLTSYARTDVIRGFRRLAEEIFERVGVDKVPA